MGKVLFLLQHSLERCDTLPVGLRLLIHAVRVGQLWDSEVLSIYVVSSELDGQKWLLSAPACQP